MSKIDNNPLLTGASGMLGKTMVYRSVRGRLQMANRPKRRRKRDFTEKQENVQSKFLEASQYASMSIQNEAANAEYGTGITESKHNAYLVAMSDYLNAPKVHSIEALGYKGAVGDTIVVKATDDFKVTSLKVVILDGNGTPLEEGEAAADLVKANLWNYKVTAANNSVPGTTIQAIAFDRPGNAAELTKVL